MTAYKSPRAKPAPDGARSHDNVRSSVFRPETLRSLAGLLDGMPELFESLPRGTGPDALKYFAEIDTDQDGFVSRSELAAHLKEKVSGALACANEGRGSCLGCTCRCYATGGGPTPA